jgi:hypothetical protein
MHVRRRIPVLWVVAVLVVCGSATAAAAVNSHSKLKLAGTWSGQYDGAFSGTFTLHWKQTGSRLLGTITLSNPSGKYGISGGVHGTAIKFGVVGAGATYTGSVSGSGKSMSGSYKSPQGGGSWSAQKAS